MYIGYTYNNRFEVEKGIHESIAYDTEYEALNHANKMWNKENENDKESNRLLVVKNVSDIKSNEKYAFFQFTDYYKCEEFVNKQAMIN